MSKENQIEETYIVNNEQIEEMANFLWKNTLIHTEDLCHDVSETCYNAGYRKIPQNIGEFSDGYHTFNELYHHRAVLFSVICNMFPEKSWKSKLHDTGDMYEGMFIVGIETEQGQATYHYDIEPYWDMFKVKELEKAPKYDGHTPSDAIKRIGNLTCAGYRKQSENVIEPPCKIGDTVYVVSQGAGFSVAWSVYKSTVRAIHLDRYNKLFIHTETDKENIADMLRLNEYLTPKKKPSRLLKRLSRR